MKTIKFIPSGKAVSDFEISKFVDDILASDKKIFHVSTNLVIDEIRARIKEKKIRLNDLDIYVTNKEGDEVPFTIDKDGRSYDRQESQEVHSNILDRLLGI